MEAADAEFRQMIIYAACAGGCRMLGRREPTAARGLNKVADKYSAQAKALLNGMPDMVRRRQASPSARRE